MSDLRCPTHSLNMGARRPGGPYLPHMPLFATLKTMLQGLLPARGPDQPPRRVLVERIPAHSPDYAPLFSRLQSLDLPESERRQRQALDVMRDRTTGKVWDLVILEDGPVPLMGLERHETR